MQTKILFSLCFLCISLAGFTQRHFYASSATGAKKTENGTSFTISVVPDKTSPSFGLYVFNPEQKKIELQISHRVNGTVVDTVITGLQYSRRFNFEQADDGQYLVTMISGKESISKTIRINTVTTRNVIIVE